MNKFTSPEVVEKQRVDAERHRPGPGLARTLERCCGPAPAGVLARKNHAAATLGQRCCSGSAEDPGEGAEKAGGHRRSGGPSMVAGATSAELERLADQPLSQLRGDWIKTCEPCPGGPENPPGAKPPDSCCAAPSVSPSHRLRPSAGTPVAPRMGPLLLRHSACWYESQRRGLRPLLGLRNGVHSFVADPVTLLRSTVSTRCHAPQIRVDSKRPKTSGKTCQCQPSVHAWTVKLGGLTQQS
ncbi:hypothetical protein BJQ89_00313 [Arthrobacter sp. ES1]|nr:hypothetical protein [Arthrobacter sp. ES1]